MLGKLRRDAALDAIDGLQFFRNVEWHDALDSTNRHLARRLKESEGMALPALVVADTQSSGVGRGKNAWWSPEGCLMFSMAIAWPKDASDFARLPLRIGLTVAETLATITTEKPLVKWPNDVYLQDRKVCGILIESTSRTASGPQVEDTSIIGIGINCRVNFSEAPIELRASAISVHELVKKDAIESTTPESVLVSFLQHWLSIEDRQREDPHWMDRAWPEWSWLDGKWVEVSQPDRQLVGFARGIDAQGALRIEDRFGRIHTILSGTVRSLEMTE
jgi:BirA family transcriptional regulator, biotin operon repressor / biotin---[acetyl-CoA-carboxylase] ligase